MAKKKRSAKKHDSLHMLIVEARFYDNISDELLQGATRVLDQAKARYDRVTVPGTPRGLAACHQMQDLEARIERPQRPLPSGRIGRWRALTAGLLLMLAGVGVAYAGGSSVSGTRCHGPWSTRQWAMSCSAVGDLPAAGTT